jgi:hypothetical protein
VEKFFSESVSLKLPQIPNPDEAASTQMTMLQSYIYICMFTYLCISYLQSWINSLRMDKCFTRMNWSNIGTVHNNYFNRIVNKAGSGYRYFIYLYLADFIINLTETLAF